MGNRLFERVFFVCSVCVFAGLENITNKILACREHFYDNRLWELHDVGGTCVARRIRNAAAAAAAATRYDVKFL